MGNTGIRLMGDTAVTVVDHGEVRPSQSRQVRTLLALLAVHARGAVDDNLLIDEIWGEQLPAHPRATLQVSLTRLRAWLGDVATLAGSGGRCTLDIDPRDVDLLAFLAAAEVALQGNDPARYDEAVALWQEPVLPGVESPRIAAVRAHAEERRRALAQR